jgi:peptidoglycan/xylan/chitin deacetylase (PgdA/CDA1 family)
MRSRFRVPAQRGGADADAFLERPETLARLALADFGAGGAGEAAFRRILHAVRFPPAILGGACRLLNGSRETRARLVAERYAYWHGARKRLDAESWCRLTRGTAILMYHAFGAAGEHASRFVVPARRFERQLRKVVRNRPLLALEELAELRRRGELPPAGAVVITVDDGYADNGELAAPLLRSLRAPATVFVVSGRVGHAADWDGAGELSGRPLLDWQELGNLAQAGVGIGAHTTTHPRLPELDAREAAAEIEQSRAELADRLGVPVGTFAYPYGRTGADVVGAVERAGFDCACGIERGLNYPGTPLFDLRRVPVYGDSSALRFALGLRFGDPDILTRAGAAFASLLPGGRRP